LILVGSGDHHIYALGKNTGTAAWKYDTGDIVRSTPTVDNDTVYYGTMNGELVALTVKSGKVKWKFKAEGNKWFPKGEFLFKPLVYKNTVYAGSRDATFYALDAKTGKLRWKVTDKAFSWYTRAVEAGGTIYAATSDGHYVQALDPVDGKEKWRYYADKLVFTMPLVHDRVLYFGSHDNYVYAVDTRDGKAMWRYKTGGDVLGSPAADNNTLYIGSDDGKLYALKIVKPSLVKVFRGVYWDPKLDRKTAQLANPISETLYHYFRSSGYEVLDSQGLEVFLKERIKDKQSSSSVVVLASYVYPYSLLQASETSPSLIRRYLDDGGTFVWATDTPQLLFALKEGEEKPAPAYKELGAALSIDQKFFYSAFFYYDSYISHPTEKGKALGMPQWWSSGFGADPKQVTTVLALDEHGRATAWIKNYGGPEGTGIIRAWGSNQLPKDLSFIKTLAEKSIASGGQNPF
jgi:hypothetical protein